ncbi:MAG: hypothetical protein U1F41_00930 [Burkholderiales bacterium]
MTPIFLAHGIGPRPPKYGTIIRERNIKMENQRGELALSPRFGVQRCP